MLLQTFTFITLNLIHDCFDSSLENLDCRVILLSFPFPLTQKKYYPLKTVGIKLKPSPSGRNSLEALMPRTSSFLLLYNGTPEISDFLFLFQVSTNRITVQVCSWELKAVLWLVERQAELRKSFASSYDDGKTEKPDVLGINVWAVKVLSRQISTFLCTL